MKKVEPLKLPKPWRLLFLDSPQLDTASSHYKKISLAFKNRNSRLIPNDIVDVWEADQDTKTIKITLEGGQEINATFQFVGTYDGQTFMWGDANKSLKQPLTKAATQFRDWLKGNEWTYFQDDNFQASLRDMMALLSLAGDSLKIENVYLASSGYNSYVALALDNVEISKKVELRSAKTDSQHNCFSRMLGRLKRDTKNAPAETGNVFSLFEILIQQINKQVAANQPNEDALMETEIQLPQIKAYYDKGDYEGALKLLNQLRPKLGTFIIDSEPAGWFFLYEGACHLALGKDSEVQTAFANAARAIRVPDYSTILLGNSRRGEQNDAAISSLKACYIYDPEWFLESATEEEIKRIETAVSDAESLRLGNAKDAKETLNAAISELYECEISAWRLSQEAAKHRQEHHQLCDEDKRATLKTNANYRHLLLAFFTPNRNPNLSSFSSDPKPRPGNYEIIEIETISDEKISATIITRQPPTETSDSYMPSTYRYLLVKTQIPLSGRRLWRIDKIWSVWPDEEILLT
mgnify:FL=1